MSTIFLACRTPSELYMPKSLFINLVNKPTEIVGLLDLNYCIY